MKLSLPDKIANELLYTRADPENFSKLSKINLILGGDKTSPKTKSEFRELRKVVISKFLFTVTSMKEDMIKNKPHIGANRFYLMSLYIQINKELGGACEH